jgi:hypothetical protein
VALVDLFNEADSLYQALLKSPPKSSWSLVVLASYSYNSNPFNSTAAEEDAPQGRLTYTPYGVEGSKTFAHIQPANFSGEIAALLIDVHGTATNPQVSVTVSAPTILNM